MVTGKTAAKAVGIIFIFGFLSRIFGFVRELILANYYGAGHAMDAYNVAFNIPGLLLSGLAAAVSTTFIPAFTDKAERLGWEGAFEFGRKVFTAFAVVGIGISILGIVFADPITRLMAPKFSPDKLALTAGLTRVLLISGVFTLLNGLCTGLLQARENFTVPALLGFPYNLMIIGSVVLCHRSVGIYALAIGLVLAFAFQVIIQAVVIGRTGFSFKPSFNFRDPELAQFSRLILPVFAGTMLLQVNTIVDRIFASGLPVGSISALGYANKINILIVALIAAAIGTVALPALSQAAAAKDLPRLRSMMLYAVRGINVLVIPMTVGMVTLRVPLVRFLFERGAFDAHATEMTAVALLFLSLGLFAYGLRDIFSKAFFAMQDTMTPMINSGVTIAVNIGLIMILAPRFGLAGLAGATSISGVFGGLQLLWRLRRKIGAVHGWAILISFIKITAAALVMGAVVHGSYPILRAQFPSPGFLHQLIALTGATLVGLLTYLTGLILLRAEEIGILKGLLSRKTKTVKA